MSDHDHERELPAGLDIATLAVLGVRSAAPETLRDGLRCSPHTQPLYQSSSYDFASVEDSVEPMRGEQGYGYMRYAHPNGRSFELTMAALEGSEDAVATASGMAALTATIVALAGAGDAVLLQADAYGGTSSLLRADLVRLGVRLVTVDAYDMRAVSRVLDAERPKLLIAETISNPLVRTADIEGLAAACRAVDARLVVDGTFATPVLSRPLAAGADVVLHSATKFLGGHHDLLAGVVCTDCETAAAIRKVAIRLGGRVPPFDAWLALRGIRTLALRMERGQSNARSLAESLGAHGTVTHVNYPGWGAMLSFDVGTRERASTAVRALRFLTLTPSLGGVRTTLSHPATSSHSTLSPEERAAWGIGEGLLRLSCGIESVDDVWGDLSGALSGV